MSMMMHGDGRMVLLNVVPRNECCPEDWMGSLVVPLYNDSDVELQRDILLYVANVFTRLLARRLGKSCEEKVFTEVQGGFMRKRSGQFVLRGLCEIQKWERKCSRYQQGLVCGGMMFCTR